MPISQNLSLPIKELIALRHELHSNPELSGHEDQTALRIVKFANKHKPDEIITALGGHGVAVVFNGLEPGPTVLIRGDIDALPIQEQNEFEYQSTNSNIAHLCGHDGHTTIVAGLIPILATQRPSKGKVVLLFQPAEETGKGAKTVLNDPKFSAIQPDFIFALHNLPGFDCNEIVLCEKEFASASKGIIAHLKGKTSHAAEPEKGINPSLAVSQIIPKWLALPTSIKKLNRFTLLTLIYAQIGEKAFGTSAGEAVVMATLRSYTNEDMEIISKEACHLVKEIAKNHQLQYNIEYVEEFPSTQNDAGCTLQIEKIAKENQLKVHWRKEPFKWSEDFGYFTKEYKGAMFGLGAGKNCPNLHNPNYDFPDEIIETGIIVFNSLIRKILT